MKSVFPSIVAVTAALSLTACAGLATGSTQSAMLDIATPPPVLEQGAPAGTSLVIVRYPAVVETDAEVTYRSNYLRTPIGGGTASPAILGPDAQAIADAAIIKSNYFALSLYKELVERLPEHSVLLSPHTVTLAEDGTLTSEPITQAESVASVLTVDFAAYSFPDPAKMMSSEPLTFGDLLTPLIVVRTDHRAAVATNGVLLASRPLLTHAGGLGAEKVNTSLTTLQDGKFAAPNEELDFISYISGGTRETIATKSLGTNATNAAQIYPVEKILLDRDALAGLATDPSGAVDPLEDVFSSPLADRIVGMLNNTDMIKASMTRRAAVVSEFDPNLAALTLTGLPDEDFKARLRYTERLLEAEQRYLSVQSLRIFDGIHNGEMGAQVRDMLQAEYHILQERRKLARQQNTATALAVLGAVAAGAAASQTGSNVNFGELVLLSTLTNAAIYAGTQAFALNRQSATIGTNYLTSIVPALEEQTSVQVSLLDANETITAIRFEDLREKLQELYSDSQRSIDTIGTSCGYAHTGSEPSGVWLGVCEAGLGAGTGVGVLRYEDGTAVEYFGYAENGQPHGNGYMIRHGELGSVAFEGSFQNGEPHGIVRVSRAGRADTLRRYENGRDAGAAPASAVAATPFAFDPLPVPEASRLALPPRPPAPLPREPEPASVESTEIAAETEGGPDAAPDTAPDAAEEVEEAEPVAALTSRNSRHG